MFEDDPEIKELWQKAKHIVYTKAIKPTVVIFAIGATYGALHGLFNVGNMTRHHTPEIIATSAELNVEDLCSDVICGTARHVTFPVVGTIVQAAGSIANWYIGGVASSGSRAGATGMYHLLKIFKDPVDTTPPRASNTPLRTTPTNEKTFSLT